MAFGIFGGKRLSSPNISRMEGGAPVEQPPTPLREKSEIPGRGLFSATSGAPEPQEHSLRRANRQALNRRSDSNLMARPPSATARRSLDLTRPASLPSSSRPSSASFGSRLEACLARLGLFKSGDANLKGCRKALDGAIDSLTWLTPAEKAEYKRSYAQDSDGSEMIACVTSLRELGSKAQTKKLETLEKQAATLVEFRSKLHENAAKVRSAPDDVSLRREREGLLRDARKQVETYKRTKTELTMINLNLRTLKYADLNLWVSRLNNGNAAARPMPR